MTLSISTDARGVRTIALDRPERHNAFDEGVIAAVTDAFVATAADPDVRVVVLRGHGPSLCAGADIGWMRRAGAWSEDENRADAMRLSDMLAAIDGCPKPVIAVAHGNVFGGGVGLVACADMAVATPTAKFRLSEVRLGLTPATISPFVVGAIGARAARRWFLTAELFDGAQAHAMGLVHAVVDDADAQVEAWVAALLDCAPGAVADAKALVRDVAGRPVTLELRADTAARIAARRASDEGREGLAAFLAKRRPAWSPDA